MNTGSVTDDLTTRSLIKKGLSYACGDGSSALANFIAFTLLLRYLSAAEFGYLSIGQAVSSWVQPLLYMGANLVAVRLIAADPEHTLIVAERTIALRLLVTLAVSSCTFVVALHSVDGSLRSVLLAYSLLFLFYPIQPDFIAIGMHRARVYSTARWIGSIFFILGVLVLTRIGIRAWMVPIAYAASLVMSAGYGYFALWPALRLCRERMSPNLGLLLRSAVFVVAAQFFQMGQFSVAVVLLKVLKVSVVLIGDYSALARLTQAAALPFVALIYSLAPVYVKQVARNDIGRIKELEARYRLCLLGVGATGAIVIATVGALVLELLSGRQIPTARHLAPIFAVSYLLLALHNSYTAILAYAGATYSYVAPYALGFITTLVTAIVLIPGFGTIGSAWSVAAGYGVIVLASYFFHRRLLRQQEKASNRLLAAMVDV
jgi:O-antigen/teichoic acid export membrane protein